MKVYPIGYSVLGAKKRIDELLQSKTLLIDTRITPWSWDEQWRKEALQDRYGDKYKFAGKYLGNEGKDLGLIRFADIDTGIDGLMRYFDQGYDLILLCQCKKYNTCHVRHIVDRLLQLLIVEVVRFEGVQQPKRSSLEEDAKELREVFEPERIIICQRSGPGKGCTMTWVSGDKVTAHIAYSGDIPAIVREVKMEGLSQKVRLTTAIDAPLLGKRIISNDKRWFDGENLKPRNTIIPELGERDE